MRAETAKVTRQQSMTLREIDEVEHVGGEAEAVAELFDEDAEVDDEQGGRIRGCSQGRSDKLHI